MKGSVVFDAVSIDLQPEMVLGQMGYERDNRVSPAVSRQVERSIRETLPLIESRGCYCVLPKEEHGTFAAFPDAEGIVLALATIDGRVEQKAREFMEAGRSATALAVDAIGTVAVEQVSNFLEREIRSAAADHDWKVSRRYAPGYCGWNLTAQRDIFRCLPETLGVELSEGCLMLPEKSLSFVCLLSRNGDFNASAIADCKACREQACPFRKE